MSIPKLNKTLLSCTLCGCWQYGGKNEHVDTQRENICAFEQVCSSMSEYITVVNSNTKYVWNKISTDGTKKPKSICLHSKHE